MRRLEAEDTAARGVVTQSGKPSASAPRQGLIGVLAVVLIFILTKGKLLLVALAPTLATFGTMALSAWFYAGLFGAPLAIGLVIMVLIHELGHGVAARLMGIRTGALIFIPFFGAFIAMKDKPRSTWQGAV